MGRNRFAERRIKEEDNLVYLIQQLDGIRAFRRIDPIKIEKSFEQLMLTTVWSRIKSDVEKIVFFPETIQGLSKLIGITTSMRSLFPIAFLSFILAMLIRIGIFKMPNDFVFLILLIFPMLIMGVFVGVDLTIRKRIANVERENLVLHQAEKLRIKNVIEDLINRLNIIIQSQGRDTKRFRLKLYFSDYEGIQVIDEKAERIFGIFQRGYTTYICIPRGKKRKKKK